MMDESKMLVTTDVLKHRACESEFRGFVFDLLSNV